MTKASDNVFPRFLISEGGSTSTPSAGRVTMYAKADGLLYSKDDAGTETLVSGGSGAALAAGRAIRTAGDLTTTSGTFVDATGMSVTITTGARRCLIAVVAKGTNDSSADYISLDIDLDGSRLGTSTDGLCFVNPPAAGYRINLSFTYLTDVLSAASHTFKLQWRRNSGGTGRLYAADPSLILSVVETAATS